MLEFYTAYLAVPAARTQEDPQAVRGRALFQQIGCASCHVPAHITAADGDHPLLSEQQIFPYTDLLLHDMAKGSPTGTGNLRPRDANGAPRPCGESA